MARKMRTYCRESFSSKCCTTCSGRNRIGTTRISRTSDTGSTGRYVGGKERLLLVLLVVFMVVLPHHVVHSSSSSYYDSSRSAASSTTAGDNLSDTDTRITNTSPQQSPATPDGINDDVTRDSTCREYLFHFLNGTTDAKDECQGFLNAWKAADCQDENQHGDNSIQSDVQVLWWYILDIFDLGKRHRAENGTIVQDDVVMDDYFENWECCSSITDFYEKHCSQPSTYDAFQMLGIMTVLVVCGFVKNMIRIAGWQWIPDAGACILVGSVVGGIVRIVHPAVVKDNLTFDNDLFLQIMLPPIVFQAALTIDKRAFRRDLFPILTLAIFGTGFSAVVIGYLTYYLSSWGNGTSLPLLDSLLFGALMSSIDPVATLSILSGVGIGHTDTLYILIFGESLLNDGVAIVLFNSLVQHLGTASDIDAATVHDTLRNFVVVTIGSIALGALCGAVCTFYFWALQGKHNAVTEVAMFFTWALVPYYLADGCGFSGIIATMVMGFLLDFFVIGGFQSEEREWLDYMNVRLHPIDQPHRLVTVWERLEVAFSQAFSGRGHIGSRSRHHVGFVAEVIANLMETAIFAYLGLFLFNDKSFSINMIFSGLFSCVSSRAIMVILFSLLINVCVWVDLEAILGRFWYMIRRSNSISISFDEDLLTRRDKVYLDPKTQLILFSAGVRGAVSYALVQNIPVYNAVTKHGSKFKNELRAMTSFTVVVLLFTFGALTYFTVQREQRNRLEREQAAGSLTTRLMSTGLTSDDGLGDDGEEVSSAFTSLELDEQSRPTTTSIQ
jgi:NhaP-type Na+/H+ or K+/H+ antiporter